MNIIKKSVQAKKAPTVIVSKYNKLNGRSIETLYGRDELHVALYDAHMYNNCGDQPFGATVQLLS